MLSRPALLRPALPAALAITGDMSPLREGIFGHSMDEYSHVSFVDLSGILKDDTAPRRKLTAMHCQERAKQASRLFCPSPGTAIACTRSKLFRGFQKSKCAVGACLGRVPLPI